MLSAHVLLLDLVPQHRTLPLCYVLTVTTSVTLFLYLYLILVLFLILFLYLFFLLNLFLFYPFPHAISRPFSRPFSLPISLPYPLPLSLLHTEGEGVLVPLTSNPPFSPALSLSPSPSLSHALSLLSVLLLDELQSLAVAWRQQVTLYRFKPVSAKPCINFYTENYHFNVLFFVNVFSFFCRLFERISSRGTHHTAEVRVLERRDISYRSTLSCAYQWSSVWCCWRR